MKWSPAYATGVERLDDQHKMLFRISEDFRVALDEGRGERVYDSLLRSLDQYARGHFGVEERCMHQCQCPAAQDNVVAHRGFIEMLAGFHARHAVNGFDRQDAQRLVDFLDRWLADHIGRIDVQIKPYAKLL